MLARLSQALARARAVPLAASLLTIRSVADLLPASFAALGAVIGFVIGATIGRILWWAVFGPESDLIPIVVGGLGSAVVFAWLGVRLSGRFVNRSVKPSY